MRRLKQSGIIGVHGICTTITAKFVQGVFIGCFFKKKREFWQLVYEDSFSLVTKES